MRRPLFLALTVPVLAASAVAAADDKADRERRVRVALALAGGDQPADACGQCRDDVTEARADGLKEGKPVVVFVGGCPGGEWAAAVKASGGIPVKTTTYDDGERPVTEKRIVLLEPKADKTGFVRSTLPTGTPAELKEKVKASSPAKKLDWDF